MSTKVKKDVIINIRIDGDLKEKSKVVLNESQMDHSKAVRMLMTYIALNNKLPDFMAEHAKK